MWKFSLSEKWVLIYAPLRFPFIIGFSFNEWNDTNLLTMTASQVYECVEVLPSAKWVLKYTTYECVEVSLLQKWVLNYATLGFPFIRGFPSHERNETILSTMTASQVYPCEKWHPSLMMTASQVYTCAKDSLSENLVLKYATLGSPFITGFPSHEWYDTHPWWWLLGKCTNV